MGKKKNEVSILRSSAAEYLTFLTATGQSDVNAIYADENVWLSQKMMGLLYDVEANTINYHLQKAFKDGELDKNSVTRIFRITASDGIDKEMHEHFAVIDREIVWYGSMNLLSREREDDNLMRLRSKEIAQELLEISFGNK